MMTRGFGKFLPGESGRNVPSGHAHHPILFDFRSGDRKVSGTKALGCGHGVCGLVKTVRPMPSKIRREKKNDILQKQAFGPEEGRAPLLSGRRPEQTVRLAG